ncbi:MAG: tetratricopeptide repeat protein [Chitinophagales bacterium]
MISFLFTRVVLMTMVWMSPQLSIAQIPFSTQPEKTQTRNGNKNYQNENFAEAEASYKKALDIKNNMPEATFNLGDAVYGQKRYDDAQKQFQLSAQTNPDPKVKALAYHNLGNTFLEQKKWEDAVKAYKQALKIEPRDADTKYNLAFANAMLRENKDGSEQDNKNEDQKKQKDQNDQQQSNDQNDQNNDQKQEQDQQQSGKQDQQNKQEQQSQGQKPRLSKEESDQLLAAVENEEQKTTQKMQQKKMKGVRVKSRKDW